MINQSGQPEPLNGGDPRWAEVRSYMADITAEAGFDTVLKDQDDEVVVVTHAAASCSVSRTSRGPMPAVSIRISFFDLSRSSTRANSMPLFAECIGAPRTRA